jgi:hypothetical protein
MPDTGYTLLDAVDCRTQVVSFSITAHLKFVLLSEFSLQMAGTFLPLQGANFNDCKFDQLGGKKTPQCGASIRTFPRRLLWVLNQIGSQKIYMIGLSGLRTAKNRTKHLLKPILKLISTGIRGFTLRRYKMQDTEYKMQDARPVTELPLLLPF